MIEIKIDDLLSSSDSIFKLTVLAGKRAQELNQGANKLVETPHNEKVTSTALKEIMLKKVTYKIKAKGE